MKSLLARALVLAPTLPAAAFAQSQATTGVIEGTVRDDSGASVPGAAVSFRKTATNFERAAESDADGRFRGLLLPLGPYRVSVTKTGFGTHVREGLELQVGQTINLPVVLEVSSVQEEVVVTGEAPVIETTRAEGSDRIDERAIAGLPNNGRNFLDYTKQVFYFLAVDAQRGRSTKQTDPSRIEQRVVDYFASIGSPSENGSIDRTNDACVFLGKVDRQLAQKHLATLRHNYTWAEQQNGTFDVDSWGRSANAVEADHSPVQRGLGDPRQAQVGLRVIW